MAIVVLGFNAVKEMGLSLSVFDVFSKTASGDHFDVRLFWEHSVACGVASRLLARTHCPRYAGKAFVAGLLHDVGKVILKQYFDAEFAEIIRLQKEEEVTLEAAEAAVIGTTHAQIGAWLAEKWNLPKLMADTLHFHHEPWRAAADTALFTACVTLGNQLCHLSGTGQSGRLAMPPLDTQAWDIFTPTGLPMDETLLPLLQNEFLLEYDKAESYLSLDFERS